MSDKIVITGGAGFIGSNLSNYILSQELGEVTVFDNLSVGSLRNLNRLHLEDKVNLIIAEIEDSKTLAQSLENASVVIHLAANANIAASQDDPELDHRLGTNLALRVFSECVRQEIPRVVYASGSGVYGDLGGMRVKEDSFPLNPISTYGASKLACESYLKAFANMYGLNSISFRFANVVGPNQTHGITYDFARRLRLDSQHLTVLGDGSQRKMYVDVVDVCRAIMLATTLPTPGASVYNLGNDSTITVKEIAEIAVDLFGHPTTQIRYGKEPRGWRGDVPLVELDDSQLRELGWKPTHNSREVIERGLKFAFEEYANE